MEQDNPKKVLVIDDDPDVHRLMKWMLERHGFHVSTAADSQSGLNNGRCAHGFASHPFG